MSRVVRPGDHRLTYVWAVAVFVGTMMETMLGVNEGQRVCVCVLTWSACELMIAGES